MDNCAICNGGPNGHTFSCAVLNMDRKTIENETPAGLLEAKPFGEGYQAFIDGKLLSNNPHPQAASAFDKFWMEDNLSYTEWNEGWFAARDAVAPLAGS